MEWIAAAISLLLVLGAVGFLVHDALSTPASAPRIHIAVDSIVPGGDGFLVEFEARNSGQATAGALQVEGLLRWGGAEVERSRATLDYVPGESSRREGLFFTRDPRTHQLEIRATGYERP